MSNAERHLAQEIRYLKLPEPTREYWFAKALGRKWRFDFAWPESKVAVEVEGATFVAGRHTQGSGFEADAEKYNEAALMGWTVLRVTPHMITDGRAIHWLTTALKGPVH